ncbi:unnamed protein product, partial [Discosporangium mesarthrocarpum]
HQQVYSALGFHEWGVAKLWRHFKAMDQTGSGDLTLWEFREYFDLPDDQSTSRLFRCFDEDRDNRIGFLEFVVGLWTYCCDGNPSLVCLAFDLCDRDHNGQITLDEGDLMLEEVFGKDWQDKGNEEARNAYDWLHGREEARLGSPELDVDQWASF